MITALENNISQANNYYEEITEGNYIVAFGNIQFGKERMRQIFISQVNNEREDMCFYFWQICWIILNILEETEMRRDWMIIPKYCTIISQ